MDGIYHPFEILSKKKEDRKPPFPIGLFVLRKPISPISPHFSGNLAT